MVERRQNPFASGDEPLRHLPDELPSAWVRHLRWFYDFFNYQYVSCRLAPPVFELGADRGKLGQWDPARRTITISALHILENPWESVLETLRHEMAHQYVHEVMLVRDAAPHGAAFAEACRVLRCDRGATAGPDELGALADSHDERDKILARVRDLLALAGSPNEHEAANAMRMAHRYLLEYNLDLADVEGRRDYGTRRIGRVARRVQEWEYLLAHILQEHFFVLSVWTFSYDAHADRLGRVLAISGTAANLEIGAYVHEYLSTVAADLWRRRSRLPAPERGTKQQYLAGLMRGFLDKLERQKGELERERALVWRGDAELDAFFRYHNPRTSTSSGGGVRRGRGYRAGKADGEKIHIRRPVEGGSRDRGRALPGG